MLYWVEYNSLSLKIFLPTPHPLCLEIVPRSSIRYSSFHPSPSFLLLVSLLCLFLSPITHPVTCFQWICFLYFSSRVLFSPESNHWVAGKTVLNGGRSSRNEMPQYNIHAYPQCSSKNVLRFSLSDIQFIRNIPSGKRLMFLPRARTRFIQCGEVIHRWRFNCK